MKHQKRYITTFTTLTTLLLVMFACQQAYSIGWSGTEVVSTDSTDDSASPSLAVGPGGTLHIAWQDSTDYGGSGTDLDIFYRSYVPGLGWSGAEVVSTDSTDDSISPSLGVGPGGTLHIAWQDRTDYGGSGTDADIFYRRYVPGLGWEDIMEVSTDSTDDSASPSLAVGPDRTVHIAWQDRTDYGGSGTDADIFYRRYVPGLGWSGVEVVSTDCTDDSASPFLAVRGGTVHIAWQDSTDYGGSGTDLDIFYRSYVPSLGWSGAEVVSTDSTDDSISPSLGVGPDGTLHIAWWDYTDYGGSGTDADIFYRRYVPGLGRSGAEVVSTDSTDDSISPSLGVGPDGTLHIAWQDRTDYGGSGTDLDIFYRSYVPSLGWEDIMEVSTDSTDYSAYPSLAVRPDGTVHIAWQDSTDYGGSGTDADIFYRSYVPSLGGSGVEVVSTDCTDYSAYPSLAVGHDGTVHIAWQDSTDYGGSGTDADIFYRSYVPGLGWEDIMEVSTDSTDDSISPSLGVGPDGTVHIAWHDETDYGGSGTDLDIFYRSYVPGLGWEDIMEVSTDSTDDSASPSLGVGPDGTVHIAWQDETEQGLVTIWDPADWDIFYRSYVPGLGWSGVEVVSTDCTDASLSPSLAVGPDGTVHIAWQDETDYGGSSTDADIFYRSYVPGLGWEDIMEVSTDSTYDSISPSLGVGPDGTVHIAWHDRTDYGGSGTDWDIFYRGYVPGLGWSGVEVVSTDCTDDSGSPSLGVGPDGTVHIAWHDSTDYGGSGTDFDIFYRGYVPGLGWSGVEVVSTDCTDYSTYPSLGVGPDGTLHIAWQDTTKYGGSDTDIFYNKLEFDLNAPTTKNDYNGNWHTADFTITLTVTDNYGVAETYYKINNGSIMSVSADGQPTITTEGSDNTLEYWSVDTNTNEEIPHKTLTGIKLDKTPPTGTIEINQGATTTDAISVTLTLSAEDTQSGIAQMRLSNDGTSWLDWKTYSTTEEWSLTAGEGPKAVYVQYKNEAGLESTIISDTITYGSGTEQKNNTEDHNGADFPWAYLILGIIVATAASAIAVYYFMKQKKTTTPQPNEQPSTREFGEVTK